MHRLSSLIVAVAVAVVLLGQPLFPVLTSADPDWGLIVNGGFEEALTTGWTQGNGTSGLMGVDGSSPHSGTGALRFNGKGSPPPIYQDINAVPGQLLQLSGWTKVTKRNNPGMKLIVEIVARHATGDLKVFTIATVMATSADYVAFTGRAVMPNRTVKARVRVRVQTLDGTAFVDDLSLVTVGAKTATPTSSYTATATASYTATSTFTPTPSATWTDTPTPRPTVTDTSTPSPTATDTPTTQPTVTYTPTPSPTATDTSTPSPTATDTPTSIPTATHTPTPVLIARPVHPFPTVPIKDFVGVNAVANDVPEDIADVAGWVRDYHKWYWYETVKDNYTWNDRWPYLDAFYNSLKSLGVKVLADVELAPEWATSNGVNSGLPDFAQHAEYMGELAKHYLPLGSLDAVENYNEPDQTLMPFYVQKGDTTGLNNFATMTAMDYDAVKSANGSLPLVIAGLKDADTFYLDRMRSTVDAKTDVLNFHWYGEGNTTVGGRNPETGRLAESIQEVAAWRSHRMPYKPIWITEFGWDTRVDTSGRLSAIYAPEDTAANYLLRSIFMMQRWGVEKAFTFIYRDRSDNEDYLGYKYLSSGLVTNDQEKDGEKKTGWYYLATLKSVLGDYVFNRVITDGPEVYHYEYAIPGTSSRAAVMWTRSGDRDNGHQVSYSGPAGRLVEPMDLLPTGTEPITTTGQLTLTEKPVFVLYDGNSSPEPPAILDPYLRPAESGGRLINGGFEDILDGWTLAIGQEDYVRPAWSTVHGGFVSGRLGGWVSGPYLKQRVPFVANELATFSGWIDVQDVSPDMNVTVRIYAYHKYNGRIGSVPIWDYTITEATNGWVHIGGTVLTPPDTASLELEIKAPFLRGTVFLDDLYLDGVPYQTPTPTITVTPSITPTPIYSPTPSITPSPTITPTPIVPPADPGLIANGSFESDFSGWSWTTWYGGNMGISTDQAHGGVKSLAMWKTARVINGPYAQQKIPVSPGDTVNFTGWYSIPTAYSGMKIYIELRAFNSTNSSIAADPQWISPFLTQTTDGWVRISGTATMPAGTSYVRLDIHADTLDGTIYLDDLSLKKSP